MQNPRLQLWLRLGTFFEIYPMLIDIHTHTHKKRHPKIIRQSNNNCYPTPDQLVTMLDEDGIDKAVVMCTVSPEMRWTIVAPEEVLEICGMHRDRLIPFCSVDPRYLAQCWFGLFEFGSVERLICATEAFALELSPRLLEHTTVFMSSHCATAAPESWVFRIAIVFVSGFVDKDYKRIGRQF